MPLCECSSLFTGDANPETQHQVRDVAGTLEPDGAGSAAQ